MRWGRFENYGKGGATQESTVVTACSCVGIVHTLRRGSRKGANICYQDLRKTFRIRNGNTHAPSENVILNPSHRITKFDCFVNEAMASDFSAMGWLLFLGVVADSFI